MLGVTEILSWGAIFYPPVVTVPLIAADHGWSKAFTMGGFSVGLFVGGLVSRHVGGAIDRYGGHVVMPCGSLIGALGLAGLVVAQSAVAYFAVWMALGVAMAASLYDPAFATLGRIFGAGARAPITTLTLAGGFASTVGWPATQFLIDKVGWRGTYLVYAALLALVAAPLHAFALPRQRAQAAASAAARPEQKTPAAVHSSYGLVFALVATAFAAYAFVPSALSAHLLAIFKRFGLAPDTVVAVGMLFGPAQVLARICELTFARDLNPLWIARFSLGLLVAAFALIALVPFSVLVASAFAVMYGMANGLMTIARGTVPLAIFGPLAYGERTGLIGAPARAAQALAPVTFGLLLDQIGLGSLAISASLCLLAFAALLFLRPSTTVG